MEERFDGGISNSVEHIVLIVSYLCVIILLFVSYYCALLVIQRKENLEVVGNDNHSYHSSEDLRAVVLCQLLYTYTFHIDLMGNNTSTITI